MATAISKAGLGWYLDQIKATPLLSAQEEKQLAWRIREHSDVPVCVGFGISTPEQAQLVGGFADGVVIGSAIVDRIEAAPSKEAAVDAVARFVSELKATLRAG